MITQGLDDVPLPDVKPCAEIVAVVRQRTMVRIIILRSFATLRINSAKDLLKREHVCWRVLVALAPVGFVQIGFIWIFSFFCNSVAGFEKRKCKDTKKKLKQKKIFLPNQTFFCNFAVSNCKVMDKQTKKEKRNEKIADLFIDLGKYTATAILITSLMGEFQSKWLLYGGGLLVVAFFIFVGIKILNKD